MNILSVSDIQVGFLYSSQIATRFEDVNLVLSCGDLPHYYLEYIISMLNVPLFYVRGNHSVMPEESETEERNFPWGATNLHHRTVNSNGLLIAGVEGCLRYNNGPAQYTQGDYWALILSMVPVLIINQIRYGRYMDIFISHAPPWQIHDMKDRAHQGIKAFRWLLDVFRPAIHIHGHTHHYKAGTAVETLYRHTRVVNAYGYREISMDPKTLAVTMKPGIYQ